MSNITCRKFCIYFFYFFFSLGVGSFLINTIVDPYNFFGFKTTDFIISSNERNIKTAYLSNNRGIFDAVLIGSSRSSYIDASKYKKYNMFNYSVSGISIDEYLPYLKFFEKTQGLPKLIILSLDFYNSNENYENVFKPDEIISCGESKLKILLDYMKIKNAYVSLNMLASEPDNYKIYYTRQLIKKRSVEEDCSLTDEVIKKTILESRSDFKKYTMRKDYKEKLIQVRESFPHSTIVVLICPIYSSLTQAINQMVGPLDYQNWISEIQTVFSHCYDFNKDSVIVNNPKNFFDASHFYPFLGDKILFSLTREI